MGVVCHGFHWLGFSGRLFNLLLLVTLVGKKGTVLSFLLPCDITSDLLSFVRRLYWRKPILPKMLPCPWHMTRSGNAPHMTCLCNTSSLDRQNHCHLRQRIPCSKTFRQLSFGIFTDKECPGMTAHVYLCPIVVEGSIIYSHALTSELRSWHSADSALVVCCKGISGCVLSTGYLEHSQRKGSPFSLSEKNGVSLLPLNSCG